MMKIILFFMLFFSLQQNLAFAYNLEHFKPESSRDLEREDDPLSIQRDSFLESAENTNSALLQYSQHPLEEAPAIEDEWMAFFNEPSLLEYILEHVSPEKLSDYLYSAYCSTALFGRILPVEETDWCYEFSQAKQLIESFDRFDLSMKESLDRFELSMKESFDRAIETMDRIIEQWEKDYGAEYNETWDRTEEQWAEPITPTD